jgi:energy-coupling factor transport system ATP-binding protein
VNIRVVGLSHTYAGQVPALRDVSLEVAAGESVAIVGQNGAGKTTLVKHLNGLLVPSIGQVTVGPWDTRNRSVAQLAAVVGYVFQNPDDQLFQPTVEKEIGFGPRNLGWPADRVAAVTRAALEQVQLAAMARQHPYDLSLSDRKRVALAAVLAMDTPIVVLDEPTTGQDYTGVELVGQIVSELKARGRTVIAVTHDIDFSAEHFERVIVMGEGRVLLDGPGRETLAQADVLSRSAVEPPQLMRLAARLGWRQTALPLTVEEFVRGWIQS